MEFSSALNICADLCPLDGSILQLRVIFYTQPGQVSGSQLPPKKHHVLHFIKYITQHHCALFCSMNVRAEQNIQSLKTSCVK